MFAKLNRFKEGVKEEIKKKSQGELAVNFWYWPGGLLADLDSNRKVADFTGDDPCGDQHAWLQTMDGFRKALRTLPNVENVEAERVKVS